MGSVRKVTNTNVSDSLITCTPCLKSSLNSTSGVIPNFCFSSAASFILVSRTDLSVVISSSSCNHDNSLVCNIQCLNQSIIRTKIINCSHWRECKFATKLPFCFTKCKLFHSKSPNVRANFLTEQCTKQGWAWDVKARDWDETRMITETLASPAEMRPRWDVQMLGRWDVWSLETRPRR